MRIVFLNPSGQLGGAERSLLDMLASLRAAEPSWAFHLIAGAAGPLALQAEALGVPTTVLPFAAQMARLGDATLGKGLKSRLTLALKLAGAALALLQYIRQLRRALRTLAPDVVHTNGFKMHVLSVLATPKDVPIIWHIRDYLKLRPVMGRVLWLLAGRCSAAIANSKSVAADVTAACGERLLVHPVYNGIDLDKFSPLGQQLDLDALAGLPSAAPETIRVGLVATLARWKGQETFLRALSLLPADLPVRGYVVGEALYQTADSQHSLDELRALAAHFGLADRVGFTGFVENTAAAMRSLDIVVHASTRPEPFGLVIVEGMACGRAVIISRAGGAAELIADGLNALTHSPGNAVELASCIERLVADASLRSELGQAAQTTAERRFDRGRLANEIIPIYRDVLPLELAVVGHSS